MLKCNKIRESLTKLLCFKRRHQGECMTLRGKNSRKYLRF
jgi:hypothetical protein